MKSLKLDCVSAIWRKWPQTLPVEFGGTLSPVRFKDESRTIAATSRDFQGSAAKSYPRTGLWEKYFPNAYEVKALSPHHRFVIALHSPKRVAETGLCVRPPEKNAGKPACGFDGTLSPVLFAGKTCGIAAIFSDSCSNVARFLCNPDWVAERLRFEPSLPFVPSR